MPPRRLSTKATTAAPRRPVSRAATGSCSLLTYALLALLAAGSAYYYQLYTVYPSAPADTAESAEPTSATSPSDAAAAAAATSSASTSSASTDPCTTAIDAAIALRRSDPHTHIAQLEQLQAAADNATVSGSTAHRAPDAAVNHCVKAQQLAALAEALADAYGYMKRHDAALLARRRQVRILEQQHATAQRHGMSKGRRARALALVQLAQDEYLDFRFDAALDTVQAARVLLGADMPPEAASILLRLESTVHECAGDITTSLQRLEEALSLLPHGTLELVRLHADVLKRTLNTAADMPASVRHSMAGRLNALQTVLIERGPWQRVDQLPRHYLPGLRAQPWHSVSDHAHVATARDRLVAAAPALRAEYAQLAAAGELMRERECIHDVAGGFWRRFEVTGYWRRLDPATGCSQDAPVACKLLQALRASGLRAIRAGYSAVGPHAWLKPHFGMTNGQLKLHLGLVVPGGNGTDTRCASFRVGNETRGWVEDDVIFFDDSFEHEVWNRCDRERVVFQVVFAHVDANATHTAAMDSWLPSKDQRGAH